jgi:dolichyl-phosphate-mannose--protein O-mannosyl transferase
LEDDTNLPEWVQSKITLAKEYIQSAADYITSEKAQSDSSTDKDLEAMKESVNEVAPEGWEKTVLAMKKHKEIDNPWALAHWMKKKGYQHHKKEE